MMEVDSALAEAAIKCDLNCYANQWRHLQLNEVEDAYGPLFPQRSHIEKLRRSGNCIHDVTFHRGIDCIKATWPGDGGRHIIQGTSVVISRTHPKIDKLRSCVVNESVVNEMGQDELHFAVKDLNESVVNEMSACAEDVDIEEGTWRLDVEINYVQYYRASAALSSFTEVGPTLSPSALQVLIGSYFGDSEQRRAINTARGLQPPAHSAALAGLNDAQKNAVERSLIQQVLPLQGPPGTGKTQVAEAIFKVWKSVGDERPMVGATPSNIAADNLANRLLETRNLRVKRYGPFDKITQDSVRAISSQQMAFKADGNGGRSKQANRRRKKLEIEKILVEETDVMIGTLEMASETQNKKTLDH